jgi:nicotinamidase/pyrazinamidase
MQIDPQTDILGLVDVQPTFMPGGELPIADGHLVVPVINRLLGRFFHAFATQDWHPANHTSFAVHNPGTKPGDVIDVGGARQVMWPVHCVQDTPGARLHEGLDQARVDEIIRKGTNPELDSYSAFFDNLHKQATGLHAWLEERWIKRVYIMGLATDYCVKHTALDARQLGYDVWVIEDGCRAAERSPGDGDRAIAELRGAGCGIVESGSIGA